MDKVPCLLFSLLVRQVGRPSLRLVTPVSNHDLSNHNTRSDLIKSGPHVPSQFIRSSEHPADQEKPDCPRPMSALGGEICDLCQRFPAIFSRVDTSEGSLERILRYPGHLFRVWLLMGNIAKSWSRSNSESRTIVPHPKPPARQVGAIGRGVRGT